MSQNKPNLDCLFEAAIAIESPTEREKFLRDSCGDDQELRAQLEALLKSDEQVGSFLDKPPAEFEVTLLLDSDDGDRAVSLDAGLASAFRQGEAVVIGNAGHSVLKSLGKTVPVPQVVLRDAEGGEEPIQRPKSAEMPKQASNSRIQLQGEIARGGMGAILKGRDTDLGRDLAVKVLLEEHKSKPEVIQRFVEEAQIGGQLQHPGIAPIYELGQFADQRPFFSMKLVKGKTLAKLLSDREDPTTERSRFLGIFEQICQTMAYAHSRGVIHRDLKPANVMVGAFGEVQVMDWGLAKVLPAGGVADEKTALDKHRDLSVIQTRRSVGSDVPGTVGSVGSETQMGSVMGTPAYMPPEQALGEIDQLDQRADVFGLGAILCEILTGKPPYVADDGTQVYRLASRGKLDDAFARLDGCGADVDLIEVAKHCLAAEPADRPKDAGVLAERVTAYLESVEQKLRETEIERAAEAARADAETAQRIAENRRAEAESARAEEEIKRRRITLALAASVLLLFGLGGGSWLYQERQEAQRQEAEALAQARHAEEQTRHAKEMESLAKEKQELATNMQNLAEARDRARKEAEEALRVAEIQGYDSAIAAAMSELERNDSRSLRRRLSRLPEHLRGWEWDYLWNKSDRSLSTPIQLPAISEGYAMVISDDGTLVASRPKPSGDWPIRIHDTRTGDLVREIKTHSSNMPELYFSPDKRYLAYNFGGVPGVQIYDLATGSPKIPGNLSSTYKDFLGFDQSGDHAVLVTRDGGRATYYKIDGWQEEGSFPGSSRSRHDDPIRIRFPIEGDLISPDGKFLISVGFTFSGAPGRSHSTVYVRSLASKDVIKEFDTPWINAIWFDPDGVHLYTVSGSDITTYFTKTWNKFETMKIFSDHASLLGDYVKHSWNQILSFDRQGEVLVLDSFNGSTRARLMGHNAKGVSIAIDWEYREVVAAYVDGSVRRWDLDAEAFGRSAAREKNVVPSPDADSHWIGQKSSRNHPSLASEMLDGTRWGGQLACCPPTISHASTLTGMAFSPDGNRIAVSTTSSWGWGRWRVYDKWTGLPLHIQEGEDSTCVGWSRDGRWIVVGHEVHAKSAGIVRIYDAETFREVKRIDDFAGHVKSLALSPDSRYFVVACQDGTLSSWSLPAGEQIHRLGKAGDPGITCLALLPGANEVIGGAIDGSVVVWNPLTGEERVRSALHGGTVTSVVVTSEGRRVLTESEDKTVRVLDTASWREILMLPVDGSIGALLLDAEKQSVLTAKRKRLQNALAKMRPLVAEAVKEQADVYQLRDKFLGDATLSEEERQAALLRVRSEFSDRAFKAYSMASKSVGRISAREVLGNQINLEGQLSRSEIEGIVQRSLERAKDLPPLEALAFTEYLPATLNAPSARYGCLVRLAYDIVFAKDEKPENHLCAYFGLIKVVDSDADKQVLFVLAAAEYRVGLYSDAIESARRCHQLYGNVFPHELAIIAMAQHRMGDVAAAKQTMEQAKALFSKIRRNDDVARVLQAEANEVLKQPAEQWDEVAAWEKCRHSLLDLGLDPVKVANWETQSIARYAERHKNDPNSPWLAKLNAPLDREIEVVETKLLEDLNQQPVARRLLQLLLKRYPTTSHFILPTAETEAVDWSFTTTPPADNWMNADFDHSAWSSSSGGFGKIGAPELNARTEWNTSDIWTRTTFPWQPSDSQHPLMLRIINDDAVEVYLNGKRVVNRANWTGNYIDLPLKTELLQTGENVIAVHCHQNAGGQHIDVGIAEIRGVPLNVRLKGSVVKLGNIWAKLSIALDLVGKTATRDRLVQRHPEAAAAIGDLSVADQQWDSAIAAYSALIDTENPEPALLVKRANVYLATNQNELAKADWLRAIERQPNLLEKAFDRFRAEQQWNIASEFGQRLIEERPNDSMLWLLKQASVLAVAENPEAYRSFCERIAKQFGKTQDANRATHVIKACLLQPATIDVAQLPVEAFVKPLDNGTTPEGARHFRWGLRGLLALRSGDAELAVKSIGQAQAHNPTEVSSAFNLSVLALAQHERKQFNEAQITLAEASKIINRLKTDPSQKGHHDLLIAEILFREAKENLRVPDTLMPAVAEKPSRKLP